MKSIRSFLRYLFVVLNCILLVFGSITFAAGLLLQFDKFYGYALVRIPYLSELWSQSQIHASPAMLISAALCCFVLGSIGLYSGYKDSRIGYGVYSVPLTFIAIVHLCIGFALYNYPSKGSITIEQSLNTTFYKGIIDHQSKEYALLNEVQSVFKCCGANSSLDYETNIPDSCLDTENNTYSSGCVFVIATFLKERLPVYGRITLAFTAIELFTVLLAWIVCFHNPVEYQYERLEE